MANFVQAAINQLSGSGSNDEVSSESLGVNVVDSSSVSASDSVEDSDELLATESAESSETVEDSSEVTDADDGSAPASKQANGSKKTSTKEVITISDESGRRKVEIDYSDKQGIRKAFEMMHGARKWQAERDRAAQERDSYKQRYEKVGPVMEALEKAFAEQGEAGVIDLIAGKQGASEEFIQKQVARAQFLEDASPQEIAALKERERLQKLEQDHLRLREENEKFKQSVTEKEEAASQRAAEATVHPVFEKYRFDGKLGDESDEQMFDEMLWNTALKRLKPYEEQGLDLTKELVEREFRTVATSLRKRINVQAEKQAAAAVNQKKQEATENAQASTMSAYKQGGARAEATDLINKGDFRNLLSNWGKYGKSLNRR